MEVSELRIGNIVDTAVGLIRVAEIPLKSNPLYNPKALHPIPISEEWLIRLGFESHKPGFFRIKIHKEQNRFLETDLSFKSFWDFIIVVEHPPRYKTEDTELWIRAIESVHQLQNLFFTLTGEELIVKDLTEAV